MATRRKDSDNSANVGAAIIATSVLVAIVFSLYHYVRLKHRYLTGPEVRRVFDIGMGWKAMLSSGAIAVIVVVLAGVCYREWPWSLVLSVPLCLWIFNWVGKVQALAFLGTVVDYQQGLVFFPSNPESLDITDYLLVLPMVRQYGQFDSLPLSEVQRITRQAGKSLFLHGDFGSRRITFTNKLKRDECIHLITAKASRRIQVAAELE